MFVFGPLQLLVVGTVLIVLLGPRLFGLKDDWLRWIHNTGRRIAALQIRPGRTDPNEFWWVVGIVAIWWIAVAIVYLLLV